MLYRITKTGGKIGPFNFHNKSTFFFSSQFSYRMLFRLVAWFSLLAFLISRIDK